MSCSQNGSRYECFQHLTINLQERDLDEGLGVEEGNITVDIREIGIKYEELR